MGKKYTTEDIRKNMAQYNYTLLSEYKNAKTKLTTICPIGHICEITWNGFQQGHRCSKCKGGTKLSFLDVFNSIQEKGYLLLDEEYKNNKSKLKILCENGHNFLMSYDNIKAGHKCPYCQGVKKYEIDYIKEFIEGIGYKLLSDNYENRETKLLVQCNKGHKWNVRWSSLLRGDKCPHCIGNAKFAYQEVKQYIENENYKLISNEYIQSHDYLDIECEKGHRYKVTFANFKNHNRRCPYCKESKGEKRIENVLNNYNIRYEIQYKFNDCKFKKHLPFDFYLPDYNICIEFDGEQHYEIVGYFGGFDNFVDTKIRDTIKNEYCKDNNIKLIRIPYWEFDDIENIIVNELNLK